MLLIVLSCGVRPSVRRILSRRINISSVGVVAEWLARSTRVRKDTGSNPAGAGHYVTTVGKLFTPTVPSRAEGRLNQLAPGTAVPL